MADEKDKAADVESVFAEYEEKKTKDAAERHARSAQNREMKEAFVAAMNRVLLPTLAALADEIRAKGCTVELSPSGGQLDVNDPNARVTLEMHPPGEKDAITPLKMVFWFGHHGGGANKSSVSIKKHIQNRSTDQSEPLTPSALSRESVRALVLRHVRDVLLDGSRQ